MPRKKSDMINEVLANFDFIKVHQVMRDLNWTWAGKGIPDIQELKDSAIYHMNGAIKQVLASSRKDHHEVPWISASGGFKALAWKTKKGKLAKVQLEFIVTDWEADNEEYIDYEDD